MKHDVIHENLVTYSAFKDVGCIVFWHFPLLQPLMQLFLPSDLLHFSILVLFWIFFILQTLILIPLHIHGRGWGCDGCFFTSRVWVLATKSGKIKERKEMKSKTTQKGGKIKTSKSRIFDKFCLLNWNFLNLYDKLNWIV